MRSKITLALQADDAEPFLRKAADDAAMYGAWCDYFTNRTGNRPGGYGVKLVDDKREWNEKFLRAKRIVEAFGVEYEQTSEEETLTIDWPWIGGKTKKGALGFTITTGSQPDYKHPYPSYRRGVHADACRAAAGRVVRKWRASIEQRQAA